jgi:hypothetical protein
MSQIEEAERAIGGVARLALLDRSGAEGFGRDRRAAARSFLAYVLVLPAFALEIAISAAGSGSETTGLFVVSEVLGEIIKAAGFPLLLLPVLALYGRRDRWAWFVAGHNWWVAAQLVFYLAMLGLYVGPLQGLGAWPVLLVLAYSWVVEAFLAEAILDVGGVKAGAIVLLDALFSFLVDHLSGWLGGGSIF